MQPRRNRWGRAYRVVNSNVNRTTERSCSMLYRTFRVPMMVTAVILLITGLLAGWEAFALVAMLGALEISFSFDNAVVNAGILERMNEYWQKIFLTVGILIAVFGMRLIFPLIIVMLTAHLGPAEVISLALDPNKTSGGLTYAQHLTAAHPAIAAFGGTFLYMIFLDFMFEDRKIKWLKPLEAALAKIGKLDQLSVVVALVTLLVVNATLVPADEHLTVLICGILGLATYLVVNSLGSIFEAHEEEVEEQLKSGNVQLVQVAGKAALMLFLYLEVLDASFSFDGVIGAFAISQNIFIIAAGLGIGAMYIRSLTVYLVRQGTLAKYVYLEHGAHWAIGALAVILFLTISIPVPEVVTGLIGVGFILAAFVSSVIRNRRNGESKELSAEENPAPSNT